MSEHTTTDTSTDVQDDLATSSLFSTQELERLAKYRAAVEVGFYTDDCSDPVSAEFDLLFFGCATSPAELDGANA